MQNTLITIGISALVGLAVWLIQRYLTARSQRIAEEKKASHDERVAIEVERRETIANKMSLMDARILIMENRASIIDGKFAEDSKNLALLKQEVLPMAEAMRRKFIEELIHPSDEFKIPDEAILIAKDVDRVLTASEQADFDAALLERITSTSPHVTEKEKLVAKLLPDMIKLAQIERDEAESAEITAVQIVTSTVKTTATKKEEEKPDGMARQENL